MSKIAICFSGLARKGYKKCIERINKIFPTFPIFYMHWKGYDLPEVENCFLFDEPQNHYHCMLDTKYKPPCPVFFRYTKTPSGKIFTKNNLYKSSQNWYKQILAHEFLVNSIDSRYETIIKIRYDCLLSDDLENIKTLNMLIQKSVEQNTVIGIANHNDPSARKTIKIHSFGDCMRCTGYYLFDHIIIHPRFKLKNAINLYEEKNLLGAEWGAHQIYCHQWNSQNFINCSGGTILMRDYTI